MNRRTLEHARSLVLVAGALAFVGVVASVGCTNYGSDFWEASDLFTPAIPIAAAIGRVSCGLDGMDYGTPTAPRVTAPLMPPAILQQRPPPSPSKA